MKLENKVAVVTGGAMGNGLGVVKAFLKYGAKVAILDYYDKIKNEANNDSEEVKDDTESKVEVDKNNHLINLLPKNKTKSTLVIHGRMLLNKKMSH